MNKKTFTVKPLTDKKGFSEVTLYVGDEVLFENGEPDIYYVDDKHLNRFCELVKEWGFTPR